MLAGLDDVAWAELDHAYGDADDVPALLRQAAVGGAGAREAVSGLWGSLFHQGSVYPATVAAVPFLVELARSAPTGRDEFVWLVGMLADPRHAYGRDQPDVKAAVARHVDALAPLLTDADPQVRAAAAYVLAQLPVPSAPLRHRWAVEQEPEVRASLLLALGHCDPDGSADVVADAVRHAAPTVRIAAALVLVRNRGEWPPDAVPAVVAAIDEDAKIEYAWRRHADWTDELLVETDDGAAAALLAGMLQAPAAATRRAGIWAMTVRAQARRSVPARLLPMVAQALTDPDDGVRAEAVGALRRGGAAAGRFADELAGIAAGYPQTTGPGFTPPYRAVETLMLLGDPRWVDPVCAAAANGHDVRMRLLGRELPWSPPVLDAVRRRLAELAAGGTAHPAMPLLVGVVGQWGTEAGPAVPELLAVLPYAAPEAARALLRIGHHDPALVPHLRRIAADSADPEAAAGVWRLAGDPQPLLDTMHGQLIDNTTRLPRTEHPVTELGALLMPLVPAARRHLTGAVAETYPQRDVQVLAARVVAAATGEPQQVLPTVRAVLVAGGTSAGQAANLVADLADTHPAAVADLGPVLRQKLGDQWSAVAAARALWRLGTPPADLVAPLVAQIGGYGDRGALPLLVAMDAATGVPELDHLAGRDERVVTAGIDDDLVWNDERLQARLRAAVGVSRGR